MKISRFLFLLTTIFCLFSGCNHAQETSQKEEKSSNKNILIVYLSRTKNTKAVASIIHKNVGGTLVELELENPYPEDYKTIVAQVAKENETGFLPPLKTKIDAVEKFDIVFVGFPTWGMQLPPPMKSFLKQYNLEGKTIIPFNTNAGYGIGSSFENVKELCPKSKVVEGFSVKGGIERDGILFVMEGDKEKQVEIAVKKWLKTIGFMN
ncbi:flavodoxin [Flavobacterium sp. MC2016-06]|uniref:flavodoxin family protein n=1 Tax=Flavobacterium sp. MC2016-06 TaxID=2676308 RepID=UPI0012BA6CF1|nr:flavodoxin [Flavobacterium sp. MC2016-06]MBU3857779.1 flavodoxin [Flavobacterium sp. MC2016-06]